MKYHKIAIKTTTWDLKFTIPKKSKSYSQSWSSGCMKNADSAKIRNTRPPTRCTENKTNMEYLTIEMLTGNYQTYYFF